jgi:hypothetical protein
MIRMFSIAMSACIAMTSMSFADELTLGEQWAVLRHQSAPSAPAWAGALPSRQTTAHLLADRARQKLGESWVRSAVALGKIESGYRCDAVGPRTRHGRAQGILQVLPGSAALLGVDPATLRTCEGGIEAGLRHMAACIESGVRTHQEMAACHVAGVKGWRSQLTRTAERYKRQYVRLASVAWAGALTSNW